MFLSALHLRTLVGPDKTRALIEELKRNRARKAALIAEIVEQQKKVKQHAAKDSREG